MIQSEMTNEAGVLSAFSSTNMPAEGDGKKNESVKIEEIDLNLMDFDLTF